MTQESKKPVQIKPLTTRFRDVFWFIKQILTKWIFWIFLILDIMALIIQYFVPGVQFPQYVYIILALIGFFWAAFKVYQELLIKYDALVNDPSKIVIELKTSLSITLIEGNCKGSRHREHFSACILSRGGLRTS